MVYGEILAGGTGTRMGNTEMPKQFLMLGEKPMIIHTLEQFLLNPKFEKILIGCPKDWISYSKEIVSKYIGNNDKIIVIEGGKDRNGTIMNACKYIIENFGASDDDIIVTHDAVRPFVNQRIIYDNINAAMTCDAVDTVIVAADTIVESVDGEFISNIPIRNYMYQGQTPQSFKINKLLSLYESLNDEEKEILTDACKIFVMKGQKVKIVSGEIYNIKVTTQHDLKLSNAILKELIKQ